MKPQFYFKSRQTQSVHFGEENVMSIGSTGSNQRQVKVCKVVASDETKLALIFIFKEWPGGRTKMSLSTILPQNTLGCC